MSNQTMPAINQSDLQAKLHQLLSLYGHRNWIVVADSAYPAQSKPGIETIVTDVPHLSAVKLVHDAIAASTHVRANIAADSELAFVDEKDAPGVSAFRSALHAILTTPLHAMAHEQIIHKIDAAAQTFHILILKTSMTIPYTSVFFELDCSYWSPEAEARLRRTMLHAQ